MEQNDTLTSVNNLLKICKKRNNQFRFSKNCKDESVTVVAVTLTLRLTSQSISLNKWQTNIHRNRGENIYRKRRTDRQTDRQTEKVKTDRHIERDRQKHKNRCRQRQTDTQTGIETREEAAERKTGIQTRNWEERQKER